MNTIRLLGDIARLVLTAQAVLYALGLMVVNIHYAEFGYISFTLVAVQYITAGTWLFVYFVLGAFIQTMAMIGIDHLKTRMQKVSHGNKLRRFSYQLTHIAVAGLAFVAFWSYVYYLSAIELRIQVTYHHAFTLVSAGLFAHEFDDLLKLLKSAMTRSETSIESVLERASYWWVLSESTFTFVLLLITFFWFLFSFSQHVYKSIPAELGGGVPARVDLVFKEGYPHSPNDIDRAIPTYLLTRTDKEVVVYYEDFRSAISIGADQIRSIIYMKTKH